LRDLCTFVGDRRLGSSGIDCVILTWGRPTQFVTRVALGRLFGIVGDLGDHLAGVVESHAAGVADGGVEGAEDEFSAAQFDGAADQGVDDFHDGGLDGFLVLKHGDGVEARFGDGDGAEHALVEITELLPAKGGGAATDSGDFDVGAGFYVWHRGPIGLDIGDGHVGDGLGLSSFNVCLCQSQLNYFFVVAG